MGIFGNRRSLSTNFLIFGALSFGAILLISIGFWFQLYHEELKKKNIQLAEESARIYSALSDTMDYIGQYTSFIGEKIAQHHNPDDLSYIANLISSSSVADHSSAENKFYFTTTFDWVTPDKMLRVSNKIGVLPTPFDMSERDYLQRTPLHPWTLQLSKPRLGGLSRQWIVPAGMGISNEQGRFIGSITLGFSLKGLEQRLRQALGTTDMQYLLLTEDLKPVLDSSIDNASGPDPNFMAIKLDKLAPLAAGYLEEPIVHNGVHFSYIKKLRDYPYVILSGYQSDMARTLFNRIVVTRGLTLFSIICAMLAAFFWMRQRFITPVVALANAADRIRQNEVVVITESPIQEINLLGSELLKISDYIQNEHRANIELNEKTRELEVANKEALDARDAAIKASHAKSEFLANMSHELRTPLNAIVGLTNIMLRKPPTPERQREFLETMSLSSQTLLELINNLLDIAKIESENVELEKLNFNFSDCVTEVVRMLSPRAQEKNIHLICHYDPALPDFIVGDPIRLKQVLINLVNNAIKFTECGGVTINVTSASENSQPKLMIYIIDTGIGIASNKLESIFDKFSQADSSITRRYGGTGLGLPLSKKLVECMGGKVSVHSRIGLGSTFSVCIPLITGTQQKSAPATHPHAKSSAPAGNTDTVPFVLLAEDHKPNILVATNLLDNLGCRYDIAHNGDDAVARAKASHYDIILMDVQMPGMDGLHATRIIREHEAQEGLPSVPIIGLTAYGLAGDREKCLQAGMDDYLSKPINIVAFNEIMLRLLRTKYPLVQTYEGQDLISKKIH